MNSIRIIYFGTSPFAVPALQALVDDDRFEVCLVVSQPDKPVGRKQTLTPSPVSVLARKRNLPLFQPDKLRGNEEALSKLRECDADFFIVAAYGKILPQSVLDIPKQGSLNLHGSILPAYRGASPIQEAILNGEQETGVSLMQMDAEMDHGPVYEEVREVVSPTDTFTTLEEKLSVAAAKLLIEKLPEIAANALSPTPQSHDDATFTKIIKKEDGKIDWSSEDAARIERKIRAFDPWPGVFTVWNRDNSPLRLRILGAEVVEDVAGAPGSVSSRNGALVVTTVNGGLRINLLQPEGKKEMDADTFLRGYPGIVDTTLA